MAANSNDMKIEKAELESAPVLNVGWGLPQGAPLMLTSADITVTDPDTSHDQLSFVSVNSETGNTEIITVLDPTTGDRMPLSQALLDSGRIRTFFNSMSLLHSVAATTETLAPVVSSDPSYPSSVSDGNTSLPAGFTPSLTTHNANAPSLIALSEPPVSTSTLASITQPAPNPEAEASAKQPENATCVIN